MVKHATFSEIRNLRRTGRAIVAITFPGRRLPHDQLVRHLHTQLANEAGAQQVLTLRTNASVSRGPASQHLVPRQRWFTLIDLDADLVDRTKLIAAALAETPRVRVRLDCLL